VLGERAAITGLHRSGPSSCGGAFRTFRTRDGWMGLSLARPSDLELVPALVEDADAWGWPSVLAWAAWVDTAEAAARARLLGLPCAERRPSVRPGVLTARGGRRRSVGAHPVVVDLTAMWAGPLCAHLLGRTGATVTKVESTSRPDGARRGPAEFFNLMHAGHEMVSVDFSSSAGREELRRLVLSADLVLESSRPRALRQLGLVAEDVVEAGITWLSITAAGRSSNAVGFGDDVAVGAGLYVEDSGDVLPCGDALGDPLAGVVAAAAASEALLGEHALLIDVSMHDVAADAASGTIEPHVVSRASDGWWVESATGRFPVAAPSRRPM
ncbi:hypothetical protein GB882_07350, partial [Georgenia ruanii]|nr:hypothetical protein [Georgenia ruanii]